VASDEYALGLLSEKRQSILEFPVPEFPPNFVIYKALQ
jgi:hypothetical protein